MARKFRDEDATLEPLQGKTVAILGYGNQGRSWSLNLRDSGIRVVVGNPEDDYAVQARADGFEPKSIAEAAQQGDIVMVILPDEVTPAIYREHIKSALTPGKTVGFASGYCVAYNQIDFPPDINVVMVAPRTLGEIVRAYYQQGRGFLSMVSVHQDADGRAWDITLALAKAIGSLKEMAIETSFKDEMELDLFTEQALIPAIAIALKTAVEVLLDAGYDKTEALLEMYMSGELGDVLLKCAEKGFVTQSSLHSPTSHYGTKSRLERFEALGMRPVMEKILREVQSGAFAEEWSSEQAAGYPHFKKLIDDFKATKFAQAEHDALQEIRSYREQSGA